MTFSLFDAPYPEYSANSAFSGNPLNRMSEKRSETCVEEALADPKALILVVAFGKLILHENKGDLDGCFKVDELETLEARSGTIVLLGWDKAGVPWLAAQSSLEEDTLPIGFVAEDFRAQLGMLAQGGALLAWHKSHLFCSRCGTKTDIKDGGYKRLCPKCEMQHFPRTDPVPAFSRGMYSCLAGFVEPGETIEDAMRRETKEETGVNVKRVAYHASQPWPFPYTLMIGCYGEAASDKITIDDELEDARWFTRDEVRSFIDGTHPEEFRMPPKGAIASNLVMHWLNEH
ncbi:Peroxisomal NADH pyrophosphatase NUDT12 [Nymphon striatum]|nr:Peroxisomal NADH pyrophosphatase NUDT12 [Nymphon striatum]